MSEKAKEKIDKKIKEILDTAYDTAISLITKNKKLHEKITSELLKKEELSRTEFSAFFE
ncbi:hypothetical protein HOF65_06815 [bacterium]|nr:hypothetical protein [bacterium]MBT3853634.1 hypothetical protein [bacterium]MBT4633180.1 hypothetical protein [bacterium]MBT5491180.1 hypothetical protein [bacterium]MBT6778705.1 hypothetical protein [bacterium]